jgi:hypothetical protein
VLDDAVHDLHQLLAAAKVSGLYILVGSSGGGFNVYHHVGRYPKEVAGLVMLDVPAGQAEMSAEDVKELAWDAPGNPEHMDYVAIERQMALHRLPIPAIPVTVITADAVQSATNPDEQKVWLTGSSRPVHLVLSGGHEIYDDNPQGVTDQIQDMLKLVQANPLTQHVTAAAGGQVRPMALLMCCHPPQPHQWTASNAGESGWVLAAPWPGRVSTPAPGVRISTCDDADRRRPSRFSPACPRAGRHTGACKRTKGGPTDQHSA